MIENARMLSSGWQRGTVHGALPQTLWLSVHYDEPPDSAAGLWCPTPMLLTGNGNSRAVPAAIC